jgi:hypothetical protein
MIIGAWRSLVAHLHGVQGVGGSNPLAPILHRRLMFNISLLYGVYFTCYCYLLSPIGRGKPHMHQAKRLYLPASIHPVTHVQGV